MLACRKATEMSPVLTIQLLLRLSASSVRRVLNIGVLAYTSSMSEIVSVYPLATILALTVLPLSRNTHLDWMMLAFCSGVDVHLDVNLLRLHLCSFLFHTIDRLLFIKSLCVVDDRIQ